MKRSINGFTIVELLIVIVVIAILAMISVVAYSGIQQRARNVARLTAAQNIYKQLELYTRQTGKSFGSDIFCLPTEANFDAGNGGLPDCYIASGPRSESAVANSNFNAQNIRFSYPATPVKAADGTDYYGIHVAYASYLNQGMNGTLRPYILIFYLEGSDQDCGQNAIRSDATKAVSDPLNSIYPARNSGYDSKRTTCYLSLTYYSTI